MAVIAAPGLSGRYCHFYMGYKSEYIMGIYNTNNGEKMTGKLGLSSRLYDLLSILGLLRDHKGWTYRSGTTNIFEP